MIEPFVALGPFGYLVGRHHGGELCSHPSGVYHLALGIAGVHADARHGDAGNGGIEVLVLQFAEVTAVDGVGPVASEVLHVKIVCSHAYLLVGIEGDAHLTVVHLLMVAQPAYGSHYLRYASLVVSTEQRRAVRNDEVFADVLKEFGEVRSTTYDAFGERDVLAVVVLYDARLDVGAGTVGRRVVMTDKAYDRTVGLAHPCWQVCWQRGIQVAFPVQRHIRKSLTLHLFFEIAREVQLFPRAWHASRLFCRLRVKPCILYESILYLH